MNQTQFDPQPSLRKPIILIGAPSGAGKTVLGRKIAAGDFPMFEKLCRIAQDKSPVQYSLKRLPDDPPRDRILIIECSTYQFEKLTSTDRWRDLLTLVRECEMAIHVDLNVPKRTLVRQYFLRIFTEPKGMNVFYRALHVSKYWNSLIYLLTDQLSRSNNAWHLFGRELAREMPLRTAFVRVLRTGTGYDLRIESAPPQVAK